MATKKAATKKRTTSGKSATKKKSARKPGTSKSASKKSAPKKATSKKSSKKTSRPRKWSKKVTETSDAMDLEQGVFKGSNPKKIAESVKRSASRSKRKKASPFQSAMSMINFYENRGGKNLSASKRKTLDKAKDELRKLFGKE